MAPSDVLETDQAGIPTGPGYRNLTPRVELQVNLTARLGTR